MITKLVTVLLYLTCLLVALATCVWFYFTFYPFNVGEAKIPSRGAKIHKQPVNGNRVEVEMTYCNYYKAPTSISYSLVNYTHKPFPYIVTQSSSKIPSGFSGSSFFNPCSTFIDASVTMPEDAPEGCWVMGITVTTKYRGRFFDDFFETEKFCTSEGGGK